MIAATTESRTGVVAMMSDLIFETKLGSTARSLGVPCITAKTIDDLQRMLNASKPALVIVDLNSTGKSAAQAIAAARAMKPTPFVIGFVSHVDTDLADHARQAGADQVMPRSQFTAQLPDLLQRHAGRAVVPDPAI